MFNWCRPGKADDGYQSKLKGSAVPCPILDWAAAQPRKKVTAAFRVILRRSGGEGILVQHLWAASINATIIAEAELPRRKVRSTSTAHLVSALCKGNATFGRGQGQFCQSGLPDVSPMIWAGCRRKTCTGKSIGPEYQAPPLQGRWVGLSSLTANSELASSQPSITHPFPSLEREG